MVKNRFFPFYIWLSEIWNNLNPSYDQNKLKLKPNNLFFTTFPITLLSNSSISERMRLGGEGSPVRTPLRTPCSLRPQPHVGKKENTKLTPHRISPRPLEPPPPPPPSASPASPLAPARTAKSLPLPSLSFHST
jgi:hypothetical protein